MYPKFPHDSLKWRQHINTFNLTRQVSKWKLSYSAHANRKMQCTVEPGRGEVQQNCNTIKHKRFIWSDIKPFFWGGEPSWSQQQWAESQTHSVEVQPSRLFVQWILLLCLLGKQWRQQQQSLSVSKYLKSVLPIRFPQKLTKHPCKEFLPLTQASLFCRRCTISSIKEHLSHKWSWHQDLFSFVTV